jgi:hypothetical protein
MDITQVLIAVNSFLLLVLGYFIKGWIAKMEEKLEKKLDATLCDERHPKSVSNCEKLFRHRHAPCFPDGHGGEVIIP